MDRLFNSGRIPGLVAVGFISLLFFVSAAGFPTLVAEVTSVSWLASAVIKSTNHPSVWGAYLVP
jgi:hypothetical protein